MRAKAALDLFCQTTDDCYRRLFYSSNCFRIHIHMHHLIAMEVVKTMTFVMQRIRVSLDKPAKEWENGGGCSFLIEEAFYGRMRVVTGKQTSSPTLPVAPSFKATK